MTYRSAARFLPLAAIVLASGIGIATAAGGVAPSQAGVVVETTAGTDPTAVAAGEAEVARLRARGVDTELRVTRSPSETVAAAATLVTRGATTLVTVQVSDVLDPLRRHSPAVRIVTH